MSTGEDKKEMDSKFYADQNVGENNNNVSENNREPAKIEEPAKENDKVTVNFENKGKQVINASIIIQLLTAALPQLEELQKNEGEAGRRKIAQITRYVALGWGLVQSIIFSLILN